MSNLRVGIIGCGLIGDVHARAITTCDGTVLGAVCDSTVERASAFAEKYGNPKVYTDYNAMLASEDIEFDEVCENLNEYAKTTGLFFMLESIKNLANNGRVSPIVAKMTGILGIRLLGRASDVGDLEALNKCRGERKTLETIVERLTEFGYAGGKLRIAHCLNKEAGEALAKLSRNKFPNADILIYKCGGLCSFYAEKGGMLVGFERG